MIRVTLYKNEEPKVFLTVEAEMANAYADYAQLNGYGIVMEAL